eukprot:m.253317 g.253317  ORF g.253317 m.253317 type:complete len:88 (-) comp26717_c0_seq4:536-799(-)
MYDGEGHSAQLLPNNVLESLFGKECLPRHLWEVKFHIIYQEKGTSPLVELEALNNKYWSATKPTCYRVQISARPPFWRLFRLASHQR